MLVAARAATGTALKIRRKLLTRPFSQSAVPDARPIRNIGIIAHIDAGKTTTTERMLYYAGVTKRLGNVDSGDTVTDYLEAERERGITIQSAAITFGWNGHQVNLIDTPGHADFNFEVVRSLRVLDGAVTILDAVAGVEALTEKVWSLASELGIPRLLYINKMDRPGAGFSRTVREAVSKLHARAVLLNIPYFENDKLVGVVDVLEQKRLVYTSDDGMQVRVEEAPEAVEARAALIDQLSEIDPEILDTFIETDDVPTDMLVSAIRRATLAGEVVPVFCGASFRNVGVQPLLDGVVRFLPAPPAPAAQESTLAKSSAHPSVVRLLAFKVRQDPQRGTLVFVRVYSGTLKRNSVVLNTNTNQTERISRILRMQADEPQEIPSAVEGEIAVLCGTQGIRTGDTLVAHATKPNGISALSKSDRETRLQPIEAPPPVFMRSIAPRGAGDARAMNAALEILLREDPSLHLQFDPEAGQHLLAGMGELHLEIATNRLVEELKARVEIGEVMITYKETLGGDVVGTASLVGNDPISNGEIRVTVHVSAADATNAPEPVTSKLIDSNLVHTTFKRHHSISFGEIKNAVNIGIVPVLARGGPIGRYALFGLKFDVSVEINDDVTSVAQVSDLVRRAASLALTENLTTSDFVLLEPVMKVQISTPQNAVGTVMTDLTTTRRGAIAGMSEESSRPQNEEDFSARASTMWAPIDHTMYMSKHNNEGGVPVRLAAQVPLRKMVGYLGSLRSMTQGRGTFEMVFSEFAEVPPQDVDSVV